jgi:hypothetical protein
MTRATATVQINVLASAGLPAWYTSQTAGTWRNFSGATQVLSSSGVGWVKNWSGDTGTYDQVIRAWSGGVLNTTGVYVGGAFVPGTWLVVWGGGHGDYYGNEVYAFGPLEAATPAWQRITDPTVPPSVSQARSGSYPCARHTYDTLAYLSSVNRMIAFGAPGYAGLGGTFPTVDVLDFAVNPGVGSPWSSRADLSNGNGLIGAISAFNPSTNKAWALGAGNGAALHCYDVAANTLTTYAKDDPFMPGASNYCSGAIIPASNILAFVDPGGVVRCVNLNTPTDAIYTPSVTGSAPTGSVAFKWDSSNNRFIAKSTQGGKQVWFLAPGSPPTAGGGTWAWTSVTPAAGDTPPANSYADYGYFGRFQVVSGTLKGIIAVSDYNAAPSFYKF